MDRKKQNTPDQARSRVEELSAEDMLRIAQKILGVLEEEHCTVAQASDILLFAKEAAATWTPVSCSLPWKAER